MKRLMALVLLSIFFMPVLLPATGEKNTIIPESAFNDKFPRYTVSQLLRNIVKARQALHYNKMADAREPLKRAHLLIEIIKGFSPNAQARDYIWVAKNHLLYEESEHVMKDLLPIYSAIEETAKILPVEKAREHLKNAMSQVDEPTKTKLLTIDKELMQLKTEPARRDNAIGIRYKDIEDKINDIIFLLRSRALSPLGLS